MIINIRVIFCQFNGKKDLCLQQCNIFAVSSYITNNIEIFSSALLLAKLNTIEKILVRFDGEKTFRNES